MSLGSRGFARMVIIAWLSSCWIPSQGRAEVPGQAWSRHFPGSPKPLDGQFPVTALVPGAEGRCAREARIVLRGMDRLASSLFGGNHPRASALARETLGYLKDRLGEGSPCFEAAMGVYLVSSALFFDVHNRYVHFTARPWWGRNHRAIPNVVFPAIVASLWSHRKLRLLTDRERALRGVGWKRHPEPPAHAILGAYDCGASTIYVDPYQYPFDLGATLLHELDHFFRDKFVDGRELTLEFTRSWTAARVLREIDDAERRAGIEGSLEAIDRLFAPDWRKALLADEILAIAHSSYIQMRISSSREFGSRVRMARYAGDFNFFTPGGALDRLNRSVQIVTQPARTFLERTFLAGSYSIDPGVREQDRIMRQVEMAYFGESPAASEEAERRDGRNDRPTFGHAGFDPLSEELEAKTAGCALPSGRLFGKVWSGVGTCDGRAWSSFALDESALLAGLDQMIEAASSSSRSCDLFHQAIMRGELDSYVGVRIDEVRLGNEGMRPGNEGMRPLLRPCLELDGLL